MSVIILTIDGKEVYNSNISNNNESGTGKDDSTIIGRHMVERVARPVVGDEYYYDTEGTQEVFKKAKLKEISKEGTLYQWYNAYILEDKDGNEIDKTNNNDHITYLYQLKPKSSGGRRKTQRKSGGRRKTQRKSRK